MSACGDAPSPVQGTLRWEDPPAPACRCPARLRPLPPPRQQPCHPTQRRTAGNACNNVTSPATGPPPSPVRTPLRLTQRRSAGPGTVTRNPWPATAAAPENSNRLETLTRLQEICREWPVPLRDRPASSASASGDRDGRSSRRTPAPPL